MGYTVMQYIRYSLFVPFLALCLSAPLEMTGYVFQTLKTFHIGIIRSPKMTNQLYGHFQEGWQTKGRKQDCIEYHIPIKPTE